MFLVILFFCLSSFIGSFFFGYKLGRSGVSYFSCLNLFFSFIFCLVLFILSLNGFSFLVTYGYWLLSFDFYVSWSFIFDSLSSSTVLVITLVSFLIHIYSISYMNSDPHIVRFLGFLSLFTAFMILLVIAGNFLLFFLAWEGVGICSYLLISFWYTRKSAVQSALEAVSFNRVGDLFLLLAIILISKTLKSLDFSMIFSKLDLIQNFSFCLLGGVSVHLIDLISLFLFIAVIAKSAQLGLHVWLPDAMEGPTPVSALLHSSTMVVAGVFLLLRCSALFSCSSTILNLTCVVGSVTAFFAASVGLVQHDIKKVIAFSTCSQLGYMVFACGLLAYPVSFYHLFNHAFFKSLLFLSAGAVIHALDDEQDMRRMGGLVSLLPFVYAVMLIGSFSLSGFPFLSGFYSKDVIVEVAFSSYTSIGWFCGFIGSASAFLTSFYCFRLLYLTFLSCPRCSYIQIGKVQETDYLTFFPLLILSLFSIFGGFFFYDVFIGLGSDYWFQSLFGSYSAVTRSPYFSSYDFLYAFRYYEFLPFSLKLFPIFFSFLGFFVSYFIYNFFYDKYLVFLILKFKPFYSFFSRRWYIDYIWFSFSSFFLSLSYVNFRVLDQGWLYYFGPKGLSSFFSRLASLLYFLQSGFLYHYLFSIFFCFSVLVLIFFKVVVVKNIIFLIFFLFLYFRFN